MTLDEFLDNQIVDSPSETEGDLPYFDNLKSIIDRDYSESLTQEDIINDPRLMEYVYGSLEGRRGAGAGSLGNQAYGLATGLAGGSRVGTMTTDYRSLEPKEAWEIFQNHQRSFAGGNTVTTVNELVYAGNVDGTTKEKLGAGYYLFDQMDNAFTGEGTWSDMGDAIWDYGLAAVWDPTTIASVGVGKLFTGAGSKASSMAVKQAMVEGVKSGVSKTAMKQAATKSTKFAAGVLLSDAAMEAGKDVMYQTTLMDTAAQEKYVGAQTAAAAIGSMLVPIGLYGVNKGVGAVRKKIGGKFGSSLPEGVDLNLSAKEAKELLDKRVNREVLINTMDSSFGQLQGDSDKMVDWAALTKDDVPLDIHSMSDRQYENSFMIRFWVGSQDGAEKGYYEALEEAGFQVLPSMLEEVGNKTGVLANAIEYLDDATVDSLMSQFETKHGRKLPLLDRTAKGLRDSWSQTVSLAGKDLWLPSTLGKIEKSGKSGRAMVQNMRGDQKVKNPHEVLYALSAYKRLITAHPGTTAANVKGFGVLYALDTVANVVAGTVAKAGEFGSTALDALQPNSGWDIISKEYQNIAYGSFTGAAKKGIAVFSPELTFEYADKILKEYPEISTELMNHLAGDSGISNAAKNFNVEGKFGVSATEKYINAVQAFSLVKVQDEVTKKIYFASAFDKNIAEVYGISPTKFWERPDALLEMHSDKFINKVVKKAVTETQDTTASRVWAHQPKYSNRFTIRNTASFVEYVSRETPLGFVVPFGSFMNTTIMHIGDYSSMNAVRNVFKEIQGIPLDYSQKSGVDLASRTIVGFSVVAAMVPAAKEKIQQGLSWEDKDRGDGTVQDNQFEWPLNQLQLMAYAYAHATMDEGPADYSKVPQGLWDAIAETTVEFGERTGHIAWDDSYEEVRQDIRDEIFGGQGLKGLGGFFKATNSVVEKATKEGPSFDILFNDILMPMVAKTSQGYTRHLEPLNSAYGLATGGNMAPDRAQGNKNVRQMFKYIDQLTGLAEDWDTQSEPSRGYQGNKDVDMGKMVGSRTGRNPTLWEAMSNSASMDFYENLSKKWKGGAEVRTVADALVSPILEYEAERAMKQYPEFFKEGAHTLESKRSIMKQLNTKAAKRAKDLIAEGVGGRGLPHLTALSSTSKKDVRKVMDFLGLEGKPEDFLDDPNGEEILRRILYFTKNMDIFLGDDELK